MAENFVCPNCVDSNELETWIRENSINGHGCSFCHPNEAGQNFNICVPLNAFVAHCSNLIEEEFIPIEEEDVFIDDLEDSMFEDEIKPLRMLVRDELKKEDREIKHQDIIEEIINNIGDPDDYWMPIDLFDR